MPFSPPSAGRAWARPRTRRGGALTWPGRPLVAGRPAGWSRRRVLALPALAGGSLSQPVRHQAWPTGPIRWVIPFPPGFLAAAQADLLAGRLDFILDSLPGAIEPLREGRLRAIAIAAPERSPLLPAVPSFAELGFPRIRMSAWMGMVAPDGTPQEAIGVLAGALNDTLAEPPIAAALAAMGAEPLIDSPALFAGRIAVDLAWLREFLPKMGITGR